MEEKLPKRKPTRLSSYDYASVGAYFITICTEGRKNWFWETVGAGTPHPQDVPLSQNGKIAEQAIMNIEGIYPAVHVDYYVIMPDHIHLLLSIRLDEGGRPMAAPTISRVIGQCKGYITKKIGKPLFQKLFYDHVIRDVADYEKHVQYILQNPARRYFAENGECTE